MHSALVRAVDLIVTGDAELCNILVTTAKVSITSSVIALIIGAVIGILLGAFRFPGNNIIVILNRTLMGMPPVVCGLLFYILFSGVGPFRHLKLLFTVQIMILAQVVLITPIVIGNIEPYVRQVAPLVKETARGLCISPFKTFLLLSNECLYPIFSAYLLAFARAIAEVGAVSMVGGAIAWKTNVMTTAIMQYTNRGDFSLGIALGMILMALSLIVNILVAVMHRRLDL